MKIIIIMIIFGKAKGVNGQRLQISSGRVRKRLIDVLGPCHLNQVCVYIYIYIN